MFEGAVHWSQADLDHARRQVALGLLPANYIEKHFEDERKAVFGENYRTDRNGWPLESGKGSAAQPTEQSIAAYKKYCKNEPGFDQHVAKMEQALADYQARHGHSAGATR